MDEESATAHQRMRVLYVAFMGSAAVYIVLAVQMRAVDAVTPLEDPGPWLWTLRAALAAFGATGVFLADRIPLNRGRTPQRRNHWMSNLRPALREVTTRTVLHVAFTEAIAIYGLLLFLLSGSFIDLLVFCGVALAVFAVRFPTRDRWASEVAAAEQAMVLRTQSR